MELSQRLFTLEMILCAFIIIQLPYLLGAEVQLVMNIIVCGSFSLLSPDFQAYHNFKGHSENIADRHISTEGKILKQNIFGGK